MIQLLFVVAPHGFLQVGLGLGRELREFIMFAP
jgi:hypothetical protein